MSRMFSNLDRHRLVQWLKTPLSGRKVLGSIPGPVKADNDANSSLLLRRFCGAKAISCEDGPRYSLDASVCYRENNEDSILSFGRY